MLRECLTHGGGKERGNKGEITGDNRGHKIYMSIEL